MVLVLTVLGVILLPLHFRRCEFFFLRPICKPWLKLVIPQVLLTVPMLDFTASTTNWITLSRKLAWKIWSTISGLVYFCFLLIFLGILVFQDWEKEKEERKKKEMEDQRKAESGSSATGQVQVQSELHDGNIHSPSPHVTNGPPV